MKTSTLTITTIMAVLSCTVSALGDEAELSSLKIRPIRIVSNDVLPPKIERQLLPDHKPGVEVFYLVEGKDLASFKSLHVDSIATSKGELPKSWIGTLNYRIGHPAKISADRKSCVFSIVVPQNLFGEADRVDVRGEVTLSIGVKREEANVELALADKAAKTVGPFSVNLSSRRVEPSQVPNDSDKKLSASDSPRAVEEMMIELEGPLERLIDVRFSDAGREVQGTASDKNSRGIFAVPIPTSGQLTMTVSTWRTTKYASVVFGNGGDLAYYTKLKAILDAVRSERTMPKPNFRPIVDNANLVSKEVTSVMKVQASSDFPAKQHLLWAARDELPRMIRGDLTTESAAERDFADRLENVLKILKPK